MPDSSAEPLFDTHPDERICPLCRNPMMPDGSGCTCPPFQPDPEFEVFTASDGEAAIRYIPPPPPSDSVRRAELEARAALEACDPDAWELVRVAHARRKMAERDRASNGK